MRKIILASHGSMAEGVLSAAKMIMGDCEEIQALGLDRYESPAEIAAGSNGRSQPSRIATS